MTSSPKAPQLDKKKSGGGLPWGDKHKAESAEGQIFALLTIMIYDLEPQGAAAGQKEKRRRLALSKNEY
ncbi:hypothetical protein [Rossellomorea marisflavi]|uniref:hypothetical protein n=1 Tax=Rossellomorea marisflavi TaxID=189381 RepID=UPI00345D856C